MSNKIESTTNLETQMLLFENYTLCYEIVHVKKLRIEVKFNDLALIIYLVNKIISYILLLFTKVVLLEQSWNKISHSEFLLDHYSSRFCINSPDILVVF